MKQFLFFLRLDIVKEMSLFVIVMFRDNAEIIHHWCVLPEFQHYCEEYSMYCNLDDDLMKDIAGDRMHIPMKDALDVHIQQEKPSLPGDVL